MPDQPEKFFVRLHVRMAVFAGSQPEAMTTAREWLQRVVKDASNSEANSVVAEPPRVVEAAGPGASRERVLPTREQEWRDKAETHAARKRPEYVDLVFRLNAAGTTDDYLLIWPDVKTWSERDDALDFLPLMEIRYLLDTLAEAERWSESHQNGPAVWNMGGLFASIKRLTAQEFAAVAR